MKVTVIIPVHNRAEFVERAISSVLAQKDACDLDILVVDDGSDDETPATLARIAAQAPEIRIVRRENGGVTKARNTGLAHLLDDTEIVTFIDSDDILLPGRFAADLTWLERDPAMEVTFGRMIVTTALNDRSLGVAKNAEVAEITGPHLTPALIRRSAIERVGSFDEELVQSEDVDFLFRLFECGTTFKQTETLCFCYLRHPGNMTNARDVMHRTFAQAILKSIQRRRADASITIDRPRFNIRALMDYKGF